MRARAGSPHWAHVPGWACGLGTGRPVVPGVRGACLRKGSSLVLDFWKKWQLALLSSESYN